MAETMYDYIGVKDATGRIRRWSDSSGKLWEDPSKIPFYVKNRSTTASITVRWYQYNIDTGGTAPTISSVYYSLNNSSWSSQSPYSNFTIPAGGIMYFRANATRWAVDNGRFYCNCMYHSGGVDLGGNIGSLLYNTNLKTFYTSSDGSKGSAPFNSMFRYNNSSTYSRSRNVYDVSRLVIPQIGSSNDHFKYLFLGQNRFTTSPIMYEYSEFGAGSANMTIIKYLGSNTTIPTYNRPTASSGTYYLSSAYTYTGGASGWTKKILPTWYT